jgi:gamma-glutamyltranspeptidase / glutathione hydrolase
VFEKKGVWIVAVFLLTAILDSVAAEHAPGKAGIASAHPLATEAGHAMLAQGGNAFDAAVAVAAALAVVEPNSSGIGGGGFILLHRASDGFNTMIDAREKAPAASTRDMFLDAQGKPVPHLSLDRALAAGIPGEPAGMAHLAAQYGRLPLKTSLQPAIRLAREGFAVYPRLQDAIEGKQDTFKHCRETARLFLKNGEVPPLGFTIKQPDLARTLELMASKGGDAFYHGAFARKLAAGVRRAGGIWTEKDLADYRTVERAPISGTYRGARIISASPPASGGIALVDALNILEAYDLNALEPATRKHVIVEAMRRMHRDRASYLGDPDFVQIPVERLTNKYYAEGQRTSLRLDRATPSEMLPSEAISASYGTQTTHFSILDRDGNRVAVTFTLNTGFGTGIVVPGTGILLNNEMDDFSVKPGAPNVYKLIGAEANSIVPGKRPLSSSTPAFVEAENGLMIVGSPGGGYIIGMVLLATLDFLDGKSAADIVSAPRIHHQYYPDVISYEPDALTEAERLALTARGHSLREGGPWGNMQVVTWNYASGRVEAAADPRGDGEGRVY